MKYQKYTDEQKIQLINECRQSGYSDYQWCKTNGVSPSTFYKWINKFRNQVCQSSNSKVIKPSEKQEVVRVDIVDETVPTAINENSALVESNIYNASCNNTLEINFNGLIIKANNDINPVLLSTIINTLRGLSC